MEAYTFVCRKSGGDWTGKKHKEGDLEASAESTYELQRKLVQTVLSTDSSGGVQSSFSFVCPDSAIFQNASIRRPDMRVPKMNDSLSWGKRKREREVESEVVLFESEKLGEDDAVVKPAMSANQIAAKVMQLRMKGKHEEADNLLKEIEKIKAQTSSRPQQDGHKRRYMHDITNRQKKKEEDADMHLVKRILTQQERCQFCFENPTRPKHLIIAIANFTYLMLPQWQPVVPGHCCILPMQHEASTRNVDNNVWDEIRNFKKCLIMMFAKQEKDVVFIETVMGLAQQRRHCLVECIPLPQDISKQAPLYFKKAIDEVEDEWSQHNSKKLIDTSVKGLRGSIPKDFPYFHVEFGLSKGFVHVIDDETQFKSNFGINVLRGMLKLPAEDMHRRRKHESVDSQKQAVGSFIQDWVPFDWTKQLD